MMNRMCCLNLNPSKDHSHATKIEMTFNDVSNENSNTIEENQ